MWASFGFLNVKTVAPREAPQVFVVGREPFRINLLNLVDGVDFEEAFSRSVEFKFGDSNLKFIS